MKKLLKITKVLIVGKKYIIVKSKCMHFETKN